MKKKTIDSLKGSNSELIEQYEGLRLSAADGRMDRSQQSYNRLLHQGMMSWLIETSTHKRVKTKFSSIEENNLKPLHQTQIMQAITNILIKKIRVKQC